MGPAPYVLVLLNIPMGPVSISWGWVSEKMKVKKVEIMTQISKKK
jgi:hypothetical protein